MASVAVLAVAEAVEHFESGVAGDLAVAVGAVAVTVLARGRGISWDELGLARRTWAAGARYGLTAAGLVLIVVAAAAALPLTRDAFVDDRYDQGIGHGLVVALLAVPLRTVIPEELAFRGVLFAAFRRAYTTRVAIVASSLLFGLWHVSSSLNLASENKAVAGPLGTGTAGQLLGVAGAVLITTGAGVVFCWLRLRSGSLLAPIGLHWAVNGAGIIASSVVWTLTT
jgi:tRNA pseudouridine32 synthase/23S rRNA pseudouridine746 synthase